MPTTSADLNSRKVNFDNAQTLWNNFKAAGYALDYSQYTASFKYQPDLRQAPLLQKPLGKAPLIQEPLRQLNHSTLDRYDFDADVFRSKLPYGRQQSPFTPLIPFKVLRKFKAHADT